MVEIIERGVGPIKTSQECTMLLSSQKRDSVGRRNKKRLQKIREEMRKTRVEYR